MLLSDMKDKCIIVCNGDSVKNIKKYNIDYNDYDIIAVNRYDRIFKLLNLPPPNYVIIGKNSLKDNINNIKSNPNTLFIGIPSYGAKNYYPLIFNTQVCYGKPVEMWGSLWWSGIYALQFAFRQQYKEIYIFGFSCTNANDFKDPMKRAPISELHFYRVIQYFKYLKNLGLLDYCTFCEDYKHHPLLSIIYSSNENKTDLLNDLNQSEQSIISP